jgi:hypothetical protein
MRAWRSCRRPALYNLMHGHPLSTSRAVNCAPVAAIEGRSGRSVRALGDAAAHGSRSAVHRVDRRSSWRHSRCGGRPPRDGSAYRCTSYSVGWRSASPAACSTAGVRSSSPARPGRGPLQRRRNPVRPSLAEPVAAHTRLSRVFSRLRRSCGGESLRRHLVYRPTNSAALGQFSVHVILPRNLQHALACRAC